MRTHSPAVVDLPQASIGPSDRTLVYLTGYGRSGSTLLSALLDGHPNVWVMGEVTEFLSRFGHPDGRCLCGERLDECDFWRRVYAGLVERVGELRTAEYARRYHEAAMFRAAPAWLRAPESSLRERVSASLVEAVREAAPANVTHFIDASKTAYLNSRRPLRLAAQLPFDIRLVHVVRDCRAVMYSYTARGLDRRLRAGRPPRVRLPALRAVIGWVAANRAAERAAREIGDRSSVMVRYEDLVDGPVEVLGRIGRAIGLEGDYDWARDGTGCQTPHQIGGNRMLRGGTLRVEPDFKWESAAPWHHDFVAGAFARRLLRRYGYG